MKKLFVLTAAMAMVFASCKKYEVSEPLDLETLPKIKLSGSVYAPLDETKPSGNLDLVPQDKLKVRISVPYRDYDPNNTSGGFYVKEATITGNGTYEVEVPYVSTGVDVTISFMDFDYMVKTQNNLGDVTSVLRHFAILTETVSALGTGQNDGGIVEGNHMKINATYVAPVDVSPNASVLVPDANKAQLIGKLEYHGSDTGTIKVASYKLVPAGTEIMAKVVLTAPAPDTRTYTEIQKIKTVADGRFTVNVPMVKGGTATVELSSTSYFEFVDTNAVTHIYQYKLSHNVASGLPTPTITVEDWDGVQQPTNSITGPGTYVAKFGDPHRFTRGTYMGVKP